MAFTLWMLMMYKVKAEWVQEENEIDDDDFRVRNLKMNS
jgi:hypothetical protein